MLKLSAKIVRLVNLKKALKYLLICVAILLFHLNYFGQGNIIDSLKLALKNAKHDTTRCNVLKLLATKAQNEDQEKYVEQLKILAEKNSVRDGDLKNFYLKHLAFVFKKIGNSFYGQANYPKALEYFFKSLKLSEEAVDKKQVGRTLGNISSVYLTQADFPKALQYFFKGLKLSEELGDKKQIGVTLANMGLLYDAQSDYPKALEYYFKSLKVSEEARDEHQVGRTLINIGLAYSNQSYYPKALEYYFKGLKISEEMEDKLMAGTALGNIAGVYLFQSDYPKALEYHLKGLKLSEEADDKIMVGVTLGNIGNLCTIMDKYKEAELNLKKALFILREIGAQDEEKIQYENLYKLYNKINRPGLALENYKKFIALRDTLFSQENSKKLMRSEMDRDYEKKTQELKYEQDKKDIQANEEKQKQKIITYSISAGLVLVLLLALFVFRGYRQKQKANLIIMQQKHEVEESKKELIDSIHYAKRIQRAMIPSDKYIEKNLSRLRNKG